MAEIINIETQNQTINNIQNQNNITNNHITINAPLAELGAVITKTR